MGRFRARHLVEEEHDDEHDGAAASTRSEEQRCGAPTNANTTMTVWSDPHESRQSEDSSTVQEYHANEHDDDWTRQMHPQRQHFDDHDIDQDLSPYHNNGHHHRQPSSRQSSFWYYALIILILAHLIARYGPPAPPPHDAVLGWKEFLLYECDRLLQSTIALLSLVPYITQWCVRGILDEVYVLYEYQHDVWWEPECELQWNSRNSTEFLVGQPRAIQVIQETLSAWETKNSEETSSFRAILLSGTVGVGKMELARKIAETMTTNNCGVLVIPKDNIQAHPDTAEFIIQHVRRRAKFNRATVVIWQHAVESALQAKHQQQQQYGDESSHSTPLHRVLQQLQQHYSKDAPVLLILTTHIGSRVIHQYLQQHDGSITDVPQLELDLALRDDLDGQFLLSNDDDDFILSDYIHAVVPFVPLGPTELQTILQRQVQQNAPRSLRIRLSDELASVLTDDNHVEYIQWQHQDKIILTFAATGAMALKEGGVIRNKVQSVIQKCFRGVENGNNGALGVLGYQDGEGVGLQCTKGDEEHQSCHEMCRFEVG